MIHPFGRWTASTTLPLLSLLALALPSLATLETSPPSPAAAADSGVETNRYIGVEQCKNCHQAKESGNQYEVWTHEKHPRAWEELGSAKAKEYGKKRGIEDPQTSEKCLKCHVTAFNEPKEKFKAGFDPKLGVQCETCHGPGEKHRKARMAAAAEEGDKKPGYTVIPDEEITKKPASKLCLGCHNDESPGYKPFCFHKFVNEVRHLNPLKPRTDAEKAALTACECDAKCACKADSKDGKCAHPTELGKREMKADKPEADKGGDKKK